LGQAARDTNKRLRVTTKWVWTRQQYTAILDTSKAKMRDSALKKMNKNIDIKESSQISLDIKTLVGIVLAILAIAGVWFTLTAQLSQLQLDVIRMQDAVGMNSEFRIKWPRGELGALPDDAKQDLRIEYLQEALAELKAEIQSLKEKTDHKKLNVIPLKND
jgi:hypothetical protein